jgi:hypothetical protein
MRPSDHYRGWPASWRLFADPWRWVAMIGGTWYVATMRRDEIGYHYHIEEIA